MSSMPDREAPGQPGGSTQQSAHPGEYGASARGGTPGQERMAGPADAGYGQQAPWGRQPGSASPVNELETRVTWRRIFQYWIDAFLVSIVPYLVSIPFDRSGSTILHIVGGLVTFVLFILIGIWYWIIRPHSHHGQTFAMQWLGLRVIGKNGGPVSMAQLFIRWICLIFDAFPWVWPFTGLLGLLVMLGSRYRQRIGDHLARTLVISTRSSVFAPAGPGAGQPGQYGQAGQYEPGGQGGQYGTTADPGAPSQPVQQRGPDTGEPGSGQPPGDVR